MKLLLLIPDGVGVRNFIYTDFIDIATNGGHEIVVWAESDIFNFINTSSVVRIVLSDLPYTDKWAEAFRQAWQKGMLKYQAKKFNDDTYLKYIQKSRYSKFSSRVKDLLSSIFIMGPTSYKCLKSFKKKYIERATCLPYYRKCLDQLRIIKPDVLFCTHQRAINAIAPLIAARSLKIATACFIYSWDNLPKATMFIEADNYLVWSEHMKRELILYHPEVEEKNIHVTGTPQFTPYFDESLRLSREEFARRYKLNPNNSWICYSGDDIRTSPYDPVYLGHLADAVKRLNNHSQRNIHIIFRRCPTDKSNRFDEILEQHSDLITAIDPLWDSINDDFGWNKIIPRKEDVALLVNTALHSDMVINVGSTMAFDFNIHNKPALFINYNAIDNKHWDIHKIYQFTHFRSMNDLTPVIWVNSKNDWSKSIKEAYLNKQVISDCYTWHSRIAMHPLANSNERIINALEKISL
jgi:hypothetical protein